MKISHLLVIFCIFLLSLHCCLSRPHGELTVSYAYRSNMLNMYFAQVITFEMQHKLTTNMLTWPLVVVSIKTLQAAHDAGKT